MAITIQNFIFPRFSTPYYQDGKQKVFFNYLRLVNFINNNFFIHHPLFEIQLLTA